MSVSPEELRASVVAIGGDVAGAYARFDPPFELDEFAARLSNLPGVSPAVADRLAATYRSMSEEFCDGGKAAVLIACGVTRAALDRVPAEGRGNFAVAIDVASARPAEWVAGHSTLLRNPDDLLRAARTAACGHEPIASALLEAFAKAGRDGTIHVICGSDDLPDVSVVDGEGLSEYGREETVVVRGDTPAETAALYSRACSAMHATMAAIA